MSVQPAQGVESEFSAHLHRYAGQKDSSLVATSEGGVPEVRFMCFSLFGEYQDR